MNESETNSERNNKRSDYIEWPEYFMATAFLAAKRSKDPVTQVGACIVNEDNKIVGVGYNGMPIGCSDNDFPWGKSDDENKLQNKHLYVCHAEMNAILNKNSADVKNCIIYVALFPCNECAKFIIQSGIKSVVYLSDKHERKISTKASKRMFDAAGISYKNPGFVCDFEFPPNYNRTFKMNKDQSNRKFPPDYITWKEYFIAIAHLASKRSEDPDVRVGACVVNEENNIVGVGYNSMPIGITDWSDKTFVLHAEKNAIDSANKKLGELRDCKIYVTLYPCDACAQLIIESGITEVIYSSDMKAGRKKTIKSKALFEAAGINTRPFQHDQVSKLVIDLHEDPRIVKPKS